jgi:hypothetical protein
MPNRRRQGRRGVMAGPIGSILSVRTTSSHPRCGVRSAGELPIGLQLAGPHLGDARLLRAAALYETARPWAGERPLPPAR